MQMYYIALLAMITLSILFYIGSRLIGRTQGAPARADPDNERWISSFRKKTKQKMIVVFQKSYTLFLQVPFIKRYVLRIRKRLATIHAYDEFTMRKETMRITFSVLGLLGLLVVLSILIDRNITSLFMSLLVVLVVNGMLIDTFVNRVEDKLLRQLANLIPDIRHNYHQHGMVEEAIYEATLLSPYEAQLHGEQIYEILTAHNPQEQLENYYEIAPNRFLKGIAGISYLIKEYGDKVVKNGSLYLSGLSKLNDEIYLEILRREKLNYLLKGLTAVAVVPMLFIKIVENWAKGHFPAMNAFYDSRIGFIAQAAIYGTITIAYILLRKMQENNETSYVVTRKWIWEKAIYNIPIAQRIIDRFVPSVHTKEHSKLSTLLKDTNSSLTLEWFTVRRIALALSSFLAVIAMTFYLHISTINNVLYSSDQSTILFGKMSVAEQQKAQKITDFDRSVIMKIQDKQHATRNSILSAIQEIPGESLSQDDLNQAEQRIAGKINTLNSEYFKSYELLLAFVIGGLSYNLPLWILYFQRRIREMDMKNEVDQFHTIITILCEFDRISVENILEWMDRFSIIFKTPLQTCLMNYESGAGQALDQLKEDAPFVPFARTIDRLQLAIEKIPIRQAFDDLESERNYYLEQRKQQYEKILDQKVSWGRFIGFAPMYVLVFLYLVFPLVYVSLNQMTSYYQQIKQLN